MFQPRVVYALLVLVLGTVAASAAPASGAEAAPVGAFQLRIPERSKSSAIATIIGRMGWGTMEQIQAAAAKDGGDVDYNPSDETFEVVVPDDYTGAEPHGLLVWISAGPTGGAPQQWVGVLKKQKLIWVGANNSGNNCSKWVRLGLAIDAAEHMQKAYKIDPARVYVSGGSGGGRCASSLSVGFPDVFTGGGYPIIGCNYFRRVDMGVGEDGRTRYFRPHFARPNARLLQVAAKERRHVLLTGDNDGNRDQTRAYAEAMKKDGFRYVTYIQVPGMGHQAPDAEWFEKGIVALDEGREAVAKAPQESKEKPVARAVAAPKAVPAASAAAPPARAAAGAPDEPSADEEAAKLMRLARLYVSNRMYAKAREKLNRIVKEHPKSPPADEARKLLKEIGPK